MKIDINSIAAAGFMAVAISATGLIAASGAIAAEKITLRMSTPASATDQRSIALAEVFAPAVAEFATYEPHYNGSLIAQGSELESINRPRHGGGLPCCGRVLYAESRQDAVNPWH